MMQVYWIVAFRNLRRHWRQSIAAIMTITVGFVAMVLFEGYIENARQLMFNEYRHRMMFGDVNIEKEGLWSPKGRGKPWNFRLSEQDQKNIDQILQSFPEVETWGRFLRIGGMATNGRNSAIFLGIGYDIEAGKKIRGERWAWNALYGSPLDSMSKDGVILGQSFAGKLDCLPNPPQKIFRSVKGYEAKERPFRCPVPTVQLSTMTSSGQTSALDLKVTGLVDSGMRDLDSRFLMVSLEQAQSLEDTAAVSYVSVLLKDPNQTKEFVGQLQKAVDEKGLKYKVLDWKDHPVIGDSYTKMHKMLTLYRNFLILILLGIAGLSILNTMIRVVRERTREIGTWRGLGYTNQQMMAVFATEALALGVIGASLGVLLSLLISFLINSFSLLYKAGLFVEPVPLAITVVPSAYLKSALILIVVCLVASIWATRKTLKKRIYENMIA